MRQSSLRLARWFALAVVGSLATVCTDSSVSPRGGKSGLSIAPVFSASANAALQAYQASGITFDRVRVTITRPPSEVLLQEEILLAGQAQTFTRDFTVSARVGDVLTARLEFLSGTTVLFAGSGSATARALDDATTPADQITVVPVGPGATTTRVTVTPATGTFPTSAPVTFTARAFDQANNEIAGAAFDWSVDNTAVASVNTTGVVQPTALGGTVRVRARALNGVTGEAIITFGAAPGLLAITTQPSGAVSGVNFTTQPVVQVRDAANNPVTTSTAAVTAAIASGTGTLVGTRTVNAVNGVATFANLRIDGAGAHTLTFTATGLTAATSSSFTVTQSISALVVQTQPGGATTGQAFTTQPVVRIVDNAGLPVVGSAVPVTARITSGTGTLAGTTTVNAANGVATFTNLRIDGSGPHTLTFSIATPTLEVASASFTVGASAPTQLAITQQPAAAVSGVPFLTQPIIEVRDAANSIVSSSNLAVTASIATGSGTLAGTTTVTAVNGVATFANLRINGAGVHTLSFTATAVTAATSNSFTVTQQIASLAIQTQPGGATSGSPLTIQPVIRVLDNAGLPVGNAIPVTATITTGTGTLLGTTSVGTTNGIATFTNLRIDGAGQHVLTFSLVSPTLQIASAPFAVGSAGATQLVITRQPSGAVSGVDFTTQPVVEVRDVNNLLFTGSAAAVTAAIASGTGTLVGTTTVTAVNGVATFTNLRINGPGAHTLSFAASGLSGATSASVTVTQTAAALAIQTQPGGAVSGSPLSIQPVIRIVDNAGILIANSTLAVTAAITTGGGTLLGTTTVTAVGGVATFTNLRVDGTGAQVLTFSTPTPALQVASGPFTIGAPVPTQLVITRQPGGAVSGVDLTTQPIVEVRDANNNLVTGTPINVTVAIAGGGALVGTVTVGAVNGVATFTNVRINGAGPHTLTFTAGTLTVTSASFTVTQNPASLAIQTQPGGGTSGAPLPVQPVIRILDNAGLVVAGYTGAVTATMATGNGTVVSGGTVNAVNGVATFTALRVDGTGPQTLTFSTSTPPLSVTSTGFAVNPTTATQIVIVTQPSGAVSGVNLTTQPVIQFRDASGAIVTGSTASVLAEIASGATGSTLVGNTTVNAVNGVATFTNLRINGAAGPYTLRFTAIGLPVVTSASFAVTQTPASLSIQTQPSGSTSGVPLVNQPVIRILDNAGLLISTSTLAVTATVASSTAGATISAGASVNAVGGLATFTNLTMTGTGGVTLAFSTATPSLSIQAAPFAVNSVPATQVGIRTQPSGAVSGVNLTGQPVVEIRDATGAIVTTSTAAVTAAIATGTGTLVGTATVNAVAGVATFTNLRINGAGAHSLTFTSPGLTAATSATFTVNQVAASLAITRQPAGSTSGSPLTTQPIVEVRDNAGLVISSFAGSVGAVVSSGSVTNGSVTAVGGVATFTSLTVTGSGQVTLTFSAAALQVVSAPFTVNPAGGVATQLAVVAQPTGAVSGSFITPAFQVEVRDANNQIVTGSSIAVAAAVATGSGTLVAGQTANAVNGVATFSSLIIAGAGSHTLRFTATGLTAATSSAFVVTQTPSSLFIQTQPSGAIAGSPLATQPVIQIRDGAGLLITTSTLAVTATIVQGNGTVVAGATVSAVGGVASFTSLRVDGTAQQVLRFAIASPAVGINSAPFTAIGFPSDLVVVTQPSSVVQTLVQIPQQPVVEVRDANNVLVPNSTLAVTVTSSGTNGTLTGTTTVAASGGKVNFTNLTLRGDGIVQLLFNPPAGSPVKGVASNNITIVGSLPTIAVVNVALQTTVKVSEVAQATPTAVDIAGNDATSTCSFTWGSSNGAVASVSAGGQVTGVSAGTATISATCRGVTGNRVVTVTP